VATPLPVLDEESDDENQLDKVAMKSGAAWRRDSRGLASAFSGGRIVAAMEEGDDDDGDDEQDEEDHLLNDRDSERISRHDGHIDL
jgi:hypothetical protein